MGRGKGGHSNRDQHSPRSNPMGEAFDYAEAFKSSTSTP
jgi:catalase (peroxidase I)